MYFKVDPESELQTKFDQLQERRQEVKDALSVFIEKLNKQLGDNDTRCYGHTEKFGGFSAKIFNDQSKIPATWRRTSYDHSAAGPSRANKYKKLNAELIKEIDALPTLAFSEYSKILNYGMYTGPAGNGQLRINSVPTIKFTTPILIQTPDFVTEKQYKPVPGLIEIKASEFHLIIEGNEELQKQTK